MMPIATLKPSLQLHGRRAFAQLGNVVMLLLAAIALPFVCCVLAARFRLRVWG